MKGESDGLGRVVAALSEGLFGSSEMREQTLVKTVALQKDVLEMTGREEISGRVTLDGDG